MIDGASAVPAGIARGGHRTYPSAATIMIVRPAMAAAVRHDASSCDALQRQRERGARRRGPQIVRHLARVPIAVGGIGREGAREHRCGGAAHRRIHRLRVRRRLTRRRQRIRESIALEEWPPAREHLEQDGAEAVDVASLIDRLAQHLLGRDVADRAGEAPAGRRGRRRGGRCRGGEIQARQAEVENLRAVTGADHDVARLEVAMDDVPRVRGAQARRRSGCRCRWPRRAGADRRAGARRACRPRRIP